MVDDLVARPVVVLGRATAPRLPCPRRGRTPRPGACGVFASRRAPMLRMARCLAPPLPKRFQLVQGQIIFGEVKEGVQRSHGMVGRMKRSPGPATPDLRGCAPRTSPRARMLWGPHPWGVPGSPGLACCTVSPVRRRMVSMAGWSSAVAPLSLPHCCPMLLGRLRAFREALSYS